MITITTIFTDIEDLPGFYGLGVSTVLRNIRLAPRVRIGKVTSSYRNARDPNGVWVRHSSWWPLVLVAERPIYFVFCMRYAATFSASRIAPGALSMFCA